MLPLAFEQNRGQSHPRARFVSRGTAYDTFITDEGADIVVRGAQAPAVVQIRLAGAASSMPTAWEPLPGTANYLIGEDPSRHIIDVPTFARVGYRSVYRDIDLVYYGTQRGLEFDLVVAPQADPRAIKLEFGGVDRVGTSADGGLRLRTTTGDVVFRKPFAYQHIDGTRRAVAARYLQLPGRRIGFGVGRYDPRHPLIIDPVLAMSSNLWGMATGVALDQVNNIHVVGYTGTADLPVAGGFQTQLAGSQDAYVAKLNPAGTAVLYTTYLGAKRATTRGLGIAVDGAGSAYITGTTTSASFPITPGAYQATGTTFVTKLKPAGNALAYSTYVGTNVAAIAVDSAGNLYMTGTATALTTTPGALQPVKIGGSAPYVAKLNPAGTAMAYATYLGGSGNDEGKGIAVDTGGNAYVVGVARSSNFPIRNPFRAALNGLTDAFVAKLDPTGTALVYSTFLGGSADERGFGVAVDRAGQAVVVGWTKSIDFPVTAGVFQPRIGYPHPTISNAFITKLNSAGDALVFSSYLGGKWCLTATVNTCLGFFGPDEGIDAATAVAIDAAGYVHVGGYATSAEFPLTDPIQSVGPGGDVQRVPFVAKIKPGGDRLAYAIVLGARNATASMAQVAVDNSGGVVAVGSLPDAPFPLTAGAVLGSGSAFLFRLNAGVYPTTVTSSINPAGAAQPITLTADVSSAAPGSVVTFMAGALTLGAASTDNGAASLTVTLAPGIHRITASNSADGKVSPPYFQIVGAQ